MDRIEIYSSKKKTIFGVIGSILLVALGLWISLDRTAPVSIRWMGIVTVLFFGWGIFIGTKKVIKSNAALIIDDKGIYINPQQSFSGFIEWNNIIKFKEIKMIGQKIMVIVVKDPEKWVENETNFLQKELMRYNLNHYGSPFSITPAGLTMTYKELNDKLNQYHQKYKNEAQ